MANDISLPPNLPLIPDDWAWFTLYDLIDKSRGISYGIVQPEEHYDDGIPILKAGNVLDGKITEVNIQKVKPHIEAKYNRTRLQGGEVLLTLVGAFFGKATVVSGEYAGWNVVRAIGVIPPKDNSQSKWLELCFRAPIVQEFIQNWANTTAQPTLNLRDVARIPIPIPPRSEQRTIAHILGSLDDKIEANRRMNETLEATARAIFKSWFVDFDPVHAKANGEQPNSMDAETAALFPDSFEDSELGMIPSRWEAGTLEDVVEITTGRSYKSAELEPSRTALVSLKSFKRGGGYKSDGLKPYIGKYKPKQVVSSGEIVVACTDVTQQAEVIGRPALVQPDPAFDTLVVCQI